MTVAGGTTPRRGLFATDMDGTLLHPGGDFHGDDIRALEALGAMEVVRVIATGRSPFSFSRMMAGRRLPVDCLVLSSGAGIMDYATGEYLRTCSMDPERTDRLVSRLTAMGYDFCVQEAIPSSHVFLYRYASGANPDLERRLRLYSGHCSPIDASTGGRPSTQAVVIVSQGRDKGKALDEIVGEFSGEYSVLRTTSPLDGESLWIEIFPPEISKSSGVMWVAERHGISREDVAAVGNDYNDHDLLVWAEHSFVVEDSPEHLRSSFREVPAVGRGGVAEAARLWLMEKGRLSSCDGWPPQG